MARGIAKPGALLWCHWLYRHDDGQENRAGFRYLPSVGGGHKSRRLVQIRRIQSRFSFPTVVAILLTRGDAMALANSPQSQNGSQSPRKKEYGGMLPSKARELKQAAG
jgi:hypothetical protein